MNSVNETFSRGPQAISEYFSQLPHDQSWDEMDLKRLADICWTRASGLVKVQAAEARKWAQAALDGYEFLKHHGHPATARSAAENAAALRSWKLLADQTTAA